MSTQMDKPPKIGTEITVRISLTFQEAPDVHTLLAMTPVRERGKLVRLALERYITEIGHPAGDVEQQIHAISTWLRSRSGREETGLNVVRQVAADYSTKAANLHQDLDTESSQCKIRGSIPNDPINVSPSINRWLET